jgi:hypothetical protein
MAWRRVAELPRKGDVLIVAQMLIAEEDYFPLHQRRPDIRNLLRGQWFPEIDPADGRAR